jgi:arylsulfatase A-like enzyme
MNLIVIMLDSLRTDYVGAYMDGQAKAKTPNMDRFAQDAVVFDKTYAGSFPTLPCRRDLFTGRWGHPFNTWGEMERDVPTLAGRLRAEGYTTGLVFDTPMFMTQGNFLDRGFGSIEWIRGQGGEPWISDGFADIKWPAPESKVKPGVMRYLMNMSRRHFESDYLGPQVMQEAVHWLERNYKQENFFLWIDSWDPHEPWDPPQYYVDMYDPGYEGDELIYPQYGFIKDIMSEREAQHVRALYAAETTMVDRWLGYLQDSIELFGLKENTMVVLMSDHGHYFGDHGLQGKPWGDLGQLYEPMARLCFMVQHPDATPGRASGLVQPVDLFPTVCELSGLSAPQGLQGQSFAGQLLGKDSGQREYAITGRNLNDDWGTVPATITDGEWTLVYWPNKDLDYKFKAPRKEYHPHTGFPERRVEELFYMPDDPGQEKNVLAQNLEHAQRLHKALLELIDTTDVEAEIARTYQRPPGENYHL